ncbi:hypothetical protein F5B22DRAFT_649201 [Xylaria bambusicola]|uniref:uncharacterized protein n=1 Tax=Xylaria bambusicola TaxID=326684 RepID=UPI0020088366|nr:uncharacterized protein F5B22DRAFT_649201 [Xylaria bambusicola]KAI0509154.1 hypothetical protein F5B22DRAFT_649201 [Xylaria bambusicola]
MRYRSITTAVVGAAGLAGAAASGDFAKVGSGPPNGYTVESMIWKGAIEKGGPELSFNGTIEEVTQRIRAVKKDFTWGPLADSGHTIEERDTKTGIICGVGGEDVSPHGPLTANAEEAGDNLGKITGTCGVPAGPKTCSVLTCTRNAAVWLCNDNDGPIAPPCSSLASYVADITGKCGQDYYHGVRYCKGQEFSSDNYNVVVGWKSQC